MRVRVPSASLEKCLCFCRGFFVFGQRTLTAQSGTVLRLRVRLPDFRSTIGRGGYHTARHGTMSRQDRPGKTVSVSWSPAQGQHRKYVGYQLGRNGKPQPKCWYLGEDEREAVRRAVEILAEWNRLTAARATAWLSQAAGGDTSGNKCSKGRLRRRQRPLYRRWVLSVLALVARLSRRVGARGAVGVDSNPASRERAAASITAHAGRRTPD